LALRDPHTPAVSRPTEEMAVVVSAPPPLAGKLSAGLRGLGAAVAVLGDSVDSALSISGSVATREEAITTLARAAETLGGFDALIHAPDVSTADTSLAGTDERDWLRLAEQPIWQALVLFQAAYASFREGGGSIVAAVPTAAITGAAGFVAFSAGAEGIRQLVKSAARAWGRDGTRVNCLTLPIEEWEAVPEPAHAVPNRYGPSLPGDNSPLDIAGAAALLIGAPAAGITGATIGIDRGTVLAP
jgi:NAD(P)-dependent dehydrogenase (short-subunit alcohol dehydrogenase family)